MKFRDLDIPDSLKEALDAQGFVDMHPPQAEAIPKALTGKNLVAAVPTASGKTLIGMIPALNTILSGRGKVLYIVPLKALASEKRDDFNKFAHLGIRVSMAIGDPDIVENVSGADVVIATSEKTDSMIRHNDKWLQGLGLIIADEIHMLHEPNRGPTLEVALTKLMNRADHPQVIALSATISNSIDLAQWLDANHVKMDWRPTKLKEGVFFDNAIEFEEGTVVEVPPEKEPIVGLVRQTVREGGQCLVFVNSRKSTEATAVKIAASTKKSDEELMSDEDWQLLVGTEGASIGKKLAECIDHGVAFHHAGLDTHQRKYVEDGFRSRKIKCIVATPTLAAGINLPARRVVVRDTVRFEMGGMSPIPVMDIKQMCGRAGRPGYDPWGEAVLIARSLEDKDHLFDDYIYQEPERIRSQLLDERTLRKHLLGLIATDDADSEEGMLRFLERTFLGATSELYGVERAISSVVEFLTTNGMVGRYESEDGGTMIKILPFGKRVSDLYIDPVSAVILKKAVERITDETEDFPILHAISCTQDILGLYPKTKDRQMLNELDLLHEDDLLCTIDEECGEDGDAEMDMDIHLSNLKTALLLDRWVREISEEAISDELNIDPGDIRSRVDNAEWILYAMKEIALIFRPEVSKKISPLLTRVKYGVKEELTALVGFRGVGRVKARTLFAAGIKDMHDVLNTDLDSLKKIPQIGEKLAVSLREQSEKKLKPESYTRSAKDDLEDYENRMNDARERARTAHRPVPEEKPPRSKSRVNKSQRTLFDF